MTVTGGKRWDDQGLKDMSRGCPRFLLVTDIEDPLLRSFYLAFLIVYVVGFIFQIVWLRKQN
jgi:hypothetical protein